VRAAIQVRVRTVPRMRKQAMEKVKPGRGRELVRRRIKKAKKARAPKELTPEVSCCFVLGMLSTLHR